MFMMLFGIAKISFVCMQFMIYSSYEWRSKISKWFRIKRVDQSQLVLYQLIKLAYLEILGNTQYLIKFILFTPSSLCQSHVSIQKYLGYANEYKERVIRKKASKFLIKEGELLYRQTTTKHKVAKFMIKFYYDYNVQQA